MQFKTRSLESIAVHVIQNDFTRIDCVKCHFRVCVCVRGCVCVCVCVRARVVGSAPRADAESF